MPAQRKRLRLFMPRNLGEKKSTKIIINKHNQKFWLQISKLLKVNRNRRGNELHLPSRRSQMEGWGGPPVDPCCPPPHPLDGGLLRWRYPTCTPGPGCRRRTAWRTGTPAGIPWWHSRTNPDTHLRYPSLQMDHSISQNSVHFADSPLLTPAGQTFQKRWCTSRPLSRSKPNKFLLESFSFCSCKFVTSLKAWRCTRSFRSKQQRDQDHLSCITEMNITGHTSK